MKNYIKKILITNDDGFDAIGLEIFQLNKLHSSFLVNN